LGEAQYADWIARGRNHQWSRRPLDALQCFRRAMREWPRGVEARFHLGETLWQLGRLDEALRAWHDVTQTDPAFLAAWQALAEGSLGTGDMQAAEAAADQVLARAQADVRARAVHAIARYADGQGERAQRIAALEALLDDPAWLGIPALGGSLALVLERSPPPGELIDRIAAAARAAGVADRLYPRLHALVCERIAARGMAPDDEAWFSRMLERALAADDHDALRRTARAAFHARSTAAVRLAQAYAGVCTAALGGTMPLLWPHRTAGARMRVVLLVDALRMPAAVPLRELPCDVTLALIGEEVDDAPASAARVLALPAVPGADDARRIAALEPDLLVDCVGLEAPTGPLLAQRPARRVVALEGEAAPNVPPLVDDTVASRAALEALIAAFESPATPSPDAATLAQAWQSAVAAHQRGDRDAADAGYAQVLAWQPGYAPALYLQGMSTRERGDLATARTRFAAALESAPRYDEARIGALSAAGAARDGGAIEDLCRDVTTTANVALLRACGLAWLAVGDAGPAASFFEAALAREPADGETHYNLGVALQMQHRHADAARAYQRALVCRPDLVAADFNLGVIFTALQNWDGAVRAFRAVLERDPKHVAAHKNLAEALLASGRIDEWLAAFKRFEQQCPQALSLAVVALEACHYAADLAALDRYLDGLRREQFVAANDAELADALEQLLYLLLYFDVEPEMLHRMAQTYDRVATHVHGHPLHRPAERLPGRLRIGYLSADLRNHVMGKMMWSALRHHDRERFALHFYSLSPVRDEWTERFAGIADRFVPLAELDDHAAVAAIDADDLDILVDLNTHTKGARPAILARKPARVQITHVASAGTTGLRAIDFKLTDAYADVPENQAYQLETLLPMEGCVYPYRRIEPAPAHGYRRAALGLADDAIVIGAFVNPLKLSRRCLALWRGVLDRIARARLAFSPLQPSLRDVYRRLATAAGIASDRVVFVPAGADEATNQARYTLVDFVLDPVPFGGVNGTLEALDMGVPVVTLLGKRHGERTSYSILANIGVTDTVAHTGREYVDLAVRLADDPAFTADVKARIAAGLAHSPLTDMPAHARRLEAAYLRALDSRIP
jgi:predicted O-linked N-acetylglucosamine transferase (SPINDLY family)